MSERKRLSASDRQMLDVSIRYGDLTQAARWLVDIWSDNVAIERGSALWEDIQRVKRALDGLRR